jgi:ABC-2 type transport system ATP-binding protein
MVSGIAPPAVSSDVVVSVRNLSKKYSGNTAVDSIDFDIHEGEIFGLIGPDGAGKTTTFHILAGIMDQTQGDVIALGTVPRAVRLQIGYLTQIFSLYLDLSVNENIEYAARIREVAEHDFLQRRENYLRLMDLHRFGDRLAGQLSGGMKQKLALCCALIARPKLLLLDEPTTGVDPVSRRDFWDVLSAITLEGVTVAVATPYLDEAERCSRVALMHKGTIHQIGSPSELKTRLNLRRLELRSEDNNSVLKALENHVVGSSNDTIQDIQQFGDRLDVLVKNSKAGEAEIHQAIAKLGVGSISIEEQDPTLENVFVSSLKHQGISQTETYPFVQSKRQSGEAIAAKSISKRFGTFDAVKNVSLNVDYGEIYGLLGANGAGKTTTIKMLCGLLDPTGGEMMLAHRKQDLRSTDLRRQIGYMSQKFVLYNDLTVIENLRFYLGTYRVPDRDKKQRIQWAISTFELNGYEDTLTGALPGGWKQKLSFAASVLHQPQIIFLDEPTSGVDPLGRRQLWDYIRQFAQNGSAILVTTHFLEEAEHCQRLGFMVDGQLVAQGTPSEIKRDEPGTLVELNVSNVQQAYKFLKEKLEPWRTSIFGSRLHVVFENPETDKPSIYSQLKNLGIAITAERNIPFSLEDAFIGIVARSKRGN